MLVSVRNIATDFYRSCEIFWKYQQTLNTDYNMSFVLYPWSLSGFKLLKQEYLPHLAFPSAS